MGMLALGALALWRRLGLAWPVTELEVSLHLLLDIGVLTWLLYFSGGSVPMAGMAEGGFELHVIGMWVSFILSACLIVGLLGLIADNIRRRDKLISRAREETLRNEHITILGSLAAGAAHELSTPLSTVALIAEIKEVFSGSEFLVGLWSMTCAPCLAELKLMAELLEDQPDLPFVLISTDPITERDEAFELLRDYGLAERDSWMFADNFTERLRYSIDPGWYGELPRSYFFDDDHRMHSHSGTLTRELLQSWFDGRFQDTE